MLAAELIRPSDSYFPILVGVCELAAGLALGIYLGGSPLAGAVGIGVICAAFGYLFILLVRRFGPALQVPRKSMWWIALVGAAVVVIPALIAAIRG